MQHVDVMTAGGTLLAALLFGAMWLLVMRNPTDKVVRRAPVSRGVLEELRGRARAWREVRANRRRAEVLARIKLTSPDSFGGVQPEDPWPRR